MVKWDDSSRAALRKVQDACLAERQAIQIYTQFRPNAVSPGDPNWGTPNPIDINGLLEMAFVEGIRYANAQLGLNNSGNK